MSPPTRPAAPAAHEDRPDTLLASTIFLMSAYAREGGSRRLAQVVMRHLELLAERADLSGVLGATCEDAADHWAVLAGNPPRPVAAETGRRTAPGQGKRGWLRLVGGTGR